ncbi:MAG: HEAT repeat domain-containing protein [Candidatus Zixiibacteriota bacterium]
MSKPSLPIRESMLGFNLNEEAHNFVREMAMACRKAAIYGTGHPLALKSVERPFFVLSAILRYKIFVNLNVRRGELFLLNLRLKDSPFNAQILQFLQLLDINAVLFDRRMRVNDFSFFVQTMVDRQSHYDSNFSLADELVKRQIDTIQLNTEQAYELFENRRQYRGDVDGDFSVRRLAMDQLGDDPIRLARIRNVNEQGLLDLGIDFDPAVVAFLLPERVAAIDAMAFRRVLTELAAQISSAGSGPKPAHDATVDYMSLFKLVELHPEKKRIVENLDDRRETSEHRGDGLTETGAIKIQTSAQIDQLFERQFSMQPAEGDNEAFVDAFARLLKTGQQTKAAEIVSRLIDLMSAPEPEYRQRALNLLGLATPQLTQAVNTVVLEAAILDVVMRLQTKSETYEYSEFLWQVFAACQGAGRYDLAAKLTKAMAARRSTDENVTIYDSMAIKKGFENIGRKKTIDALVRELIGAGGETAVYLKEILVAIGSEEIALALSQIISHPQRSVRQLTLRILADLGKASLKVFSRILNDDKMFVRDPQRHELPDEKWYVVRNSIFVFGSLRDPQGVGPLRARIDDTDIRVRREIVGALEKIGGEEAIDCLTLMAEDPINEVRDAAIIAIGLVGRPESAPVLIDIARRDPRNSIKAVTALGKLGGSEAHEFLGRLLNDPQLGGELTHGVVSKDELRVAAVRALGQIGRPEAIEHIRQFRDSQSATQKILFKNSAVNKAISEVLLKH